MNVVCRLGRLLSRRRRALALLVALSAGFGAGGKWLLNSNPFPLEKLRALPQSCLVRSWGTRDFPVLGIDEQWRLPISSQDMSPWLAQATVAVEDERFASHPGVDLLAVGRASLQNVFAGRVVSEQAPWICSFAACSTRVREPFG